MYKTNINVPPTKSGELKDLSFCPDSYDPKYVEEGWYSFWEKNDFFKPSHERIKVNHQECIDGNENTHDKALSNEKQAEVVFSNHSAQNVSKCNTSKEEKPCFVIPLPPPNVTGSLHIGHAMMASIQDVLIRYHRMNGFETLYVPGTDHAGIATQAVVEKKIYKEEKIFKEDIGRERFLERVFDWKSLYGSRIYEQMKRMGSSLDFSRETFTLDASYSESVTEAFNLLFESELIYRESKIVNWSGKMKTTLSDLEVVHEEIKGGSKIKVDDSEYVFGVLYYFRYPIIKKLVASNSEECRSQDCDDKNPFACVYTGGFTGFIDVSTTRPETILGDSAICLNPNDKRDHLKDYYAVNPLTRRIIPIIYDNDCDINFGTGALKITPSHDYTDYEIGKRHNLEFINIFTSDNKICTDGIKNYSYENTALDKETHDFLETLNGKKRFDGRFLVISYLKKKNLFLKEEFKDQTLPFCSRSHDIIEPMIKKQWWMRCKDLGKKAGDAVRNGEIEIHPVECKKVWYNWVDNIRDWCLSRQLWWGHRIPAWRVYKNERYEGWEVARKVEDVIDRIKQRVDASNTQDSDHNKSKDDMHADTNDDTVNSNAYTNTGDTSFVFNGSTYTLKQDEDVLDTWFSSGLWPFAIFRWPRPTLDLQKYFPNSLLETGYDILFFWVARMVMLSIQLCKVSPFKKILLHGIVRDAHGKKMSKSLGNVIDPVYVIEGINLVDLNNKIENVNEKERVRAVNAQKKDFPNGIPQCGADALRFGLCAYFNGVKDINLDVLRVEGYRRLCNKIWNAYKFVKNVIRENHVYNDFDKLTITSNFAMYPSESEASSCTLHLDWIMHKRNETVKGLRNSIESFNFMQATQIIYKFFLNDFCDVFIEIIKKKRSKKSDEILVSIFEDITKMFHPFMPFITEEIFQRLKYDALNSKVRVTNSSAHCMSSADDSKSLNANSLHDSNSLYASKSLHDPKSLHDSISVNEFPKVNNDQNVNLNEIKFFDTLIALKKGISSILNSNSIKKSKIEILSSVKNDFVREFLEVFIKNENEISFVEKVSGEFIDCVENIRFGIKDTGEVINESESKED